VSDDERHGFDVREFVRKWGLDAASGGGAHMWREIWDKDVSLIYKDILSEFSYSPHLGIRAHLSHAIELDEPCFGHPPKLDVYAELKRRQKYTL